MMNLEGRIKTILIILICFVNIIFVEAATIRSVADAEYIESMELAIGKCRQQCFLQTIDNWTTSKEWDTEESIDLCCNYKHHDCAMCHDYCYSLILAELKTSQAMCDDPGFCYKGCQIACEYHSKNTIKSLKFQANKYWDFP